MSTPEQLVDQIKVATDYQKNKKQLKEKILTDLHVTYNDGLFLITTDLISFLATWTEEDLFLEDVYNNPIKVKREELLTKAKECYQAVMNEWHIEHEKLKRIRKV